MAKTEIGKTLRVRDVLCTAALFIICAYPGSAQSKLSTPQRDAVYIRQSSEFTCGAAAVASLLTFHLNHPATEDEIARLSGTYIKRTSEMVDLRNALEVKGYRARGYKGKNVTLAWLESKVDETGVPVLVHFGGPLPHYVLFIGLMGDFVLVTDPARGEVSMHKSDFLRRSDNKVLVVTPQSPPDRSLIDRRKRIAKVRLSTLRLANSLTFKPNF